MATQSELVQPENIEGVILTFLENLRPAESDEYPASQGNSPNEEGYHFLPIGYIHHTVMALDHGPLEATLDLLVPNSRRRGFMRFHAKVSGGEIGLRCVGCCTLPLYGGQCASWWLLVFKPKGNCELRCGLGCRPAGLFERGVWKHGLCASQSW